MKLKIVLLALVGAAGATASLALADSGHHGRVHAKKAAKDQPCSRAVVFGTAAPQSFTVTVKHAGPHSQFKTGDVVTVSVGGQGQDVGVTGFGCATGSTLQAGSVLLHVRLAKKPRTTTTTTQSTTTTGDRGKGRGHHDPHGGTTTTTTTTATTTAETTTAQTTTADTTTGETTTTSSNNDTSNGL